MTRTGQLELTFAHEAALDRASEWATAGRSAVEVLVRFGYTFTAEDVRTIAGDPPAHGDAMGALLRSLSGEGLIEACGYDKAKRPDAKGRVLRVWRGRS
jgi:hypothetical protein